MKLMDCGKGLVKAMDGDREVLSAILARTGEPTPGKEGAGGLFVTDLKGTATIEEIQEAAALLKDFVEGEEIRLVVAVSHERHDAVIRLYEAIGAEREFTVMRWK